MCMNDIPTELAGDGTGYRIEMREDYVIPGVFRQPSRAASGCLGLHEGQIEELSQGERKQNEQEHRACEEHEDRECATRSPLKSLSPYPSVDMVVSVQ